MAGDISRSTSQEVTEKPTSVSAAASAPVGQTKADGASNFISLPSFSFPKNPEPPQPSSSHSPHPSVPHPLHNLEGSLTYKAGQINTGWLQHSSTRKPASQRDPIDELRHPLSVPSPSTPPTLPSGIKADTTVWRNRFRHRYDRRKDWHQGRLPIDEDSTTTMPNYVPPHLRVKKEAQEEDIVTPKMTADQQHEPTNGHVTSSHPQNGQNVTGTIPNAPKFIPPHLRPKKGASNQVVAGKVAAITPGPIFSTLDSSEEGAGQVMCSKCKELGHVLRVCPQPHHGDGFVSTTAAAHQSVVVRDFAPDAGNTTKKQARSDGIHSVSNVSYFTPFSPGSTPVDPPPAAAQANLPGLATKGPEDIDWKPVELESDLGSMTGLVYKGSSTAKQAAAVTAPEKEVKPVLAKKFDIPTHPASSGTRINKGANRESNAASPSHNDVHRKKASLHGNGHDLGAEPTPNSLRKEADWTGNQSKATEQSPPAALANDSVKPRHSTRRSKWPRKKELQEPKEYEEWDEPLKEIDYNDISHLVDWDGNWLPAPVEWEGRRAYQSQNFYKNISDWIDKGEEVQDTVVKTEGTKKLRAVVLKPAIFIDHPAFNPNGEERDTYPPNCDIAPRCWAPQTLEDRTPLDVWWRSFPTNPPRTLNVDDLDGCVPFWHSYLEDGLPYQRPVEVPDCVLDPTDEQYELGKMGPTSNERAHRFLTRQERAETAAKAARRAAKRAAREPPPVFIAPPAAKPRINIYIRYAKTHDINQITDIYNWHVRHTCNVTEVIKRNPADMRARLQDVHTAELPFIVAVEKANKKAQGGNTWNVYEHVVGFAYADDYNHRDGMFRYAVELEIYVHPEYFLRGIGAALLDRMNAQLDPNSFPENNAQWYDDTPNNGTRIVGHIMAHVPYDTLDKGRKMVIEMWLKKNGFEQTGQIMDIGIKHLKSTSLMIFKKRTRMYVDPINAYEKRFDWSARGV